MTEDEPESSRRPDGRPASAPDGVSERRQWILVGVLLACVIGFPVAILLWPPTILSFRDAFLGLAMIPGLLLGGTAVWLALGGRS